MSLTNFLNTFNDITGRKVYAIDPLSKFEFNIEVEPGDSMWSKWLTDAKLTGSGLIQAFGSAAGTDIGMFVQSVQLPQFSVSTESADSQIGKFVVPQLMLTPSQNTFTMTVVNTQHPICEAIFYPWLREVTSPVWQYVERPYTIAKITIDMKSHSDVKYVLLGCRPQSITPMNASHNQQDNSKRNITMMFDFMFVTLEAGGRNWGSNDLLKLVGNVASQMGISL